MDMEHDRGRNDYAQGSSPNILVLNLWEPMPLILFMPEQMLLRLHGSTA
jgi:hypothetical protein